MTTDVPSKSRTIEIWALRVVLGIVFLYVGTTKLAGTGNTVEYFAAIGWGQWFRYVTGLLDIAGVALIFFAPKWICFGAIVLACSVGLGALISLTVLRGNPTWGSSAVVAVTLVLALLAVLLAWLTRPPRAS